MKREYNKKPLLIGLDLQRPAAMDQLEILAKNNNIDYHHKNINKQEILMDLNNITNGRKLNIKIQY